MVAAKHTPHTHTHTHTHRFPHGERSVGGEQFAVHSLHLTSPAHTGPSPRPHHICPIPKPLSAPAPTLPHCHSTLHTSLHPTSHDPTHTHPPFLLHLHHTLPAASSPTPTLPIPTLPTAPCPPTTPPPTQTHCTPTQPYPTVTCVRFPLHAAVVAIVIDQFSRDKPKSISA